MFQRQSTLSSTLGLKNGRCQLRAWGVVILLFIFILAGWLGELLPDKIRGSLKLTSEIGGCKLSSVSHRYELPTYELP